MSQKAREEFEQKAAHILEQEFSIVYRLRKRAEIRRKATCRGADDRLANDLDEAANEIERLRNTISWMDETSCY